MPHACHTASQTVVVKNTHMLNSDCSSMQGGSPYFHKTRSGVINLTVAPCIFAESLQFLNQWMHIQFHIKHI